MAFVAIKRVIASTARHNVIATAAGNGVVTLTARKVIIAFHAIDGVIAGTAIDNVITRQCVDIIIFAGADQDIIKRCCPAIIFDADKHVRRNVIQPHTAQCDRAVCAQINHRVAVYFRQKRRQIRPLADIKGIQRNLINAGVEIGDELMTIQTADLNKISTRTTRQGVVPRPPIKGIIAIATNQAIFACTTMKDVVAFFTVQVIRTIAPKQGVRAVTGPDGVITFPAIDGVGTDVGFDIVKAVVTIAQIDFVILAVAINIIVMGRCDDFFKVRKNVARRVTAKGPTTFAGGACICIGITKVNLDTGV